MRTLGFRRAAEFNKKQKAKRIMQWIWGQQATPKQVGKLANYHHKNEQLCSTKPKSRTFGNSKCHFKIQELRSNEGLRVDLKDLQV